MWFFNCVARLERVQFAPLDYRAVSQIRHAMTTRRFALFPGQEIPRNVYDVYYTICCNKVSLIFDLIYVPKAPLVRQTNVWRR